MDSRVCMLGLPGSGKTSYLASLYELISHDDVEGAPQLNALPDDRQYLQRVHERWLRCEPAVRTRDAGSPTAVEFSLTFDDSEEQTLAIPDVAGEAVRALWEERRWKSGLDDLARGASGILLFTKADEIVQPVRVQRVIDPETPQAQPLLDDEPDVAATAFDPEKSPTQVKLVDLLGAVIELEPTRKLRVSLVLSAWDRVQHEGVTPAELVRLRMPLLWQYLVSNPELFAFNTYGVSAQGGDFAEPSAAERILAVDPPAHRATIVSDQREEASHDVSLPLRWLWASQ